MANKWDERYAAGRYFYGTEPNDFLVEHVAEIPAGGDVLCLAEGEGRNAVFLAGRGLRPVALDQSSVGLAKATRLAAARGVTLSTLHADLDSYVFEPRRWDGIVSIWCHLPTALRLRVHRQVVEALRPGGVFLLEAYRPDQLRYRTGGPSELDLLPTLQTLRSELQGLEFTHAQELDRTIQEGDGHAGLSAVVQVVCRKAG